MDIHYPTLLSMIIRSLENVEVRFSYPILAYFYVSPLLAVLYNYKPGSSPHKKDFRTGAIMGVKTGCFLCENRAYLVSNLVYSFGVFGI